MKPKEVVESVKYFFEWLFGIQHWNSLEGWIARFLIWIAVVYLLLFVLKHLLELVFKIKDLWGKLGLPAKLSSEKRNLILRRKNFCRAILSDLATIAKAEQWNDQYFTDLEAEVEAEGGYYASMTHRVLGKRSYGLRRVPSLIKAIESSAEQSLLLVGNPGSGKSVALRHLATQLAEKATSSSELFIYIPLYINLKEFELPQSESPTADQVQEFVIANIRRGDADTADYVREHWEQFRDEGIWFFLFDSFDEIPAVMHAPSGSHAIQDYSEAIRKFLSSMNSCRSVLASREYKGPDKLPWQKLRILALTSDKQIQLVENSLLSQSSKGLALRQLAVTATSLFRNPMFLTLLCRYVKNNDQAPKNDFDLLRSHIVSLANRDSDYISKQYRLNSGELLDGAAQLARLFAEVASLSLAPKQDEIREALVKTDISIVNIEYLLAALVDVKIGRSDVAEARAGDRRFTFSHRRYQETLFVQYLVEDIQSLDSRELLLNLRWREYVVTLLQSYPVELVRPLLGEAEAILTQAVKVDEPTPSKDENLEKFQGFDWDSSSSVVHLLKLLEEAFSQRVSEIPKSLAMAVASFLDRRWAQGDLFDKLMVIEHGGCMSKDVLLQRIEFAIESNIPQLEAVAFEKIGYLDDVTPKLGVWIRKTIARRLTKSSERSDILRLEALSARLPNSTNVEIVVKRCRELRAFFMGIYQRLGRGLFRARRLTGGSPIYERSIDRLNELMSTSFLLIVTIMLCLGVFVLGKSLLDSGWNIYEATGMLGCLLGAGFNVRHFVRYCFKHAPERLTFEIFTKEAIPARDVLRRVFVSLLVFSLTVASALFLVTFILWTGNRILLSSRFNFDDCFAMSVLVVVFGAIALISISEDRSDKRKRKRLDEILKSKENGLSVIALARTRAELMHWLRDKRFRDNFLGSKSLVRSLIGLLGLANDSERLPEPFTEFFRYEDKETTPAFLRVIERFAEDVPQESNQRRGEVFAQEVALLIDHLKHIDSERE